MNELTPQKDPAPSLIGDAVDQQTDNFLRAQAIVDAINQNITGPGRKLTPISKEFVFRKANREVVSVALHAAFAMRGGVPALVDWAEQEPDKFYALWARLGQTDTETPVGGTTVIVQTSVPMSPLDMVSVNELGQVISVDAQVQDEELPE